MNEDLLMDLADCGSPEGLASIIHSYIPFKEDNSVNLEKIAEAVGIVEIRSSDSDRYAGFLITNETKSQGSIVYNSKSNVFRRRFTIAHELGHFLLPYHNKNAECVSSDMGVLKSKNSNLAKECEANRFAIELLAPTKEVKACLRKFKTPNLEQIINLSKRFQISKEAAAKRYIECTDHDVGIVFTNHRIVSYHLRTEIFPYMMLSKGKEVPPHIAHQINTHNVGDYTEWYCVDPYYFLSEPSLLNGQELYCQTFVQEGGYSISLLSVDDD